MVRVDSPLSAGTHALRAACVELLVGAPVRFNWWQRLLPGAAVASARGGPSRRSRPGGELLLCGEWQPLAAPVSPLHPGRVLYLRNGPPALFLCDSPVSPPAPRPVSWRVSYLDLSWSHGERVRGLACAPSALVHLWSDSSFHSSWPKAVCT